MLNLWRLDQLCRLLKTDPEKLASALESPSKFIKELLLCDPAGEKRPRRVIDVSGDLRLVQERFYRRVLLQRLWPSHNSHGGIRGRSIKSNVIAHAGSRFAFKSDIRNFYPSIHRRRVYRLFADRLHCSADVARACTALTTFNHHLALGLVSSPILADQILCPIDNRIAEACKSIGVVYTRFVDDITLSARYDLRRSNVASIVRKILGDHGFEIHPGKEAFGRLEDLAITGIRMRDSKLDVTREYADRLDQQLKDAKSLADGAHFDGPFQTFNQLRGKVQFVGWVNPGRKAYLMRRLFSIGREKYRREAINRGLVASKTGLMSLDPTPAAQLRVFTPG
ncbi:reverse transcriptase family protein [Candidatus Laterigemmans baculatus]|uniref:reverse transcriptase family protein n=1 Tax=Candidatus Laterigemmans baculatus TaxID=2770505 RepID=UPI0013DD51BB|nr:reverse transcriptase family protein [Candidatus Laterigemmans baculatus]